MKQACTANNIFDDFQSTLGILRETWKSCLFVFLTYCMTYTVFPSIIVFRNIPDFVRKEDSTILQMRTAFAIYVMLLFYAGIWLGFCAVYRRKRKDISIRSSTIITVIRVVCTTLILIDSVLDRPGIAAAVFDSFLVLLLGLTHSIMVYYHLASKPNLQDVTLQYQDMAGTIRTLS